MRKIALTFIVGLLMSATVHANDIPTPVVGSYMADYGVSQTEAVRRLV